MIIKKFRTVQLSQKDIDYIVDFLGTVNKRKSGKHRRHTLAIASIDVIRKEEDENYCLVKIKTRIGAAKRCSPFSWKRQAGDHRKLYRFLASRLIKTPNNSPPA